MSFSKINRDRLGVERNFDNGSKSAEMGVIGTLLQLGQDYRVWDEIEDGFGLSDTHFYDDLLSRAFKCGIAISGRGENVNFVTLCNEVCDTTGRDYKAVEEVMTLALQSAGDTKNLGIGLDGWIKLVIQKYQDRMLAMAGSIVQEMPSIDDGRTKEQQIAEAMQILAAAGEAAVGGGAKILNGKQIKQAAWAEIKAAQARGTGMVGLSTGFKELDELTQGLKSEELVILAARPAMGKTALALSMMHTIAVKQQKPTLFISLEMGKAQIGMRWLALDAEVTISSLRTGRVSDYDQKNIDKSMEGDHDQYFNFDESSSLTVHKLAARARKVHAQYADQGGLGLLVVDYLQLITDTGRANSNKAERVGDISRALKELSRELKIPVVALSQLNRKLEERADKRPMMSDLRDSGAIEQDADVIIFLYRDEVYNEHSVDAGTAEIIIAKQRNGGLGTVRVDFDGPLAKFKDMKAGSSVPKTYTMEEIRRSA